jgi:glucokinase
MTIDYEGPFARSGIAGAVEAYLGQHFLSRYARYCLMNRRDSIVHTLTQDRLKDLTPSLLYEAAMRGDAGATEVFAWAGHKLGCALGSAVNLLDIRKIVVGGGISAAGDLILEPARKSIHRYVTPGLLDDVEILQEPGGNEMGLLGAAHLVFESLDHDPDDNQD